MNTYEGKRNTSGVLEAEIETTVYSALCSSDALTEEAIRYPFSKHTLFSSLIPKPVSFSLSCAQYSTSALCSLIGAE